MEAKFGKEALDLAKELRCLCISNLLGIFSHQPAASLGSIFLFFYSLVCRFVLDTDAIDYPLHFGKRSRKVSFRAMGAICFLVLVLVVVVYLLGLAVAFSSVWFG